MMSDEAKAKHRAYNKLWNRRNPKKAAEYNRRYLEKKFGPPKPRIKQTAEDIAYYAACWQEANREYVAERKRAWVTANPDKVREYRKRSKRKGTRPHNRRRTIALCKDKEALARRIVERATNVTPRSIPDHVRKGIIAMLVERVYSGILPLRLTAEHGQSALADYRRENERFAYETVSLDDVLGDDGFTRGAALGIY